MQKLARWVKTGIVVLALFRLLSTPFGGGFYAANLARLHAPPAAPPPPTSEPFHRSAEVAGPVVTEALPLIGAAAYHQRGILGQGVSVAVIDAAYAGVAERIAAGELPADLITRRFLKDGSQSPTLFESDTPHGAACAEIVHDVAPAARLYLIQVEALATTFPDVLDYLIAEGVRVVSISISSAAPGTSPGQTPPEAEGVWEQPGVWGQPGVWRQTGALDQALALARQHGLLVVKSAGNYADKHYRGAFSDADGDGWHEFSAPGAGRPGLLDEDIDVLATRGEPLNVILRWQNGGAAAPFALVLFDDDGVAVARSTPDASASAAALRHTPARDGAYHLGIHSPGGSPQRDAPPIVDILAKEGVAAFQEYQVPAGSLGAPAGSPDVLTVAAANVATGLRLAYSSQGDADTLPVKPDLTGYANVSVSAPAYRTQGFSGTSAAAPHVAGMAALLLSRPELAQASGDEIAALLLAAAADRGAPGKDPLWGAGLAQLPPLGVRMNVLSVAGDTGLLHITATLHRDNGAPLDGLRPADFTLYAGGLPAPALTVRQLGGTVYLAARRPPGLAPGAHPLIITARDATITATVDLAGAAAPVAGSATTAFDVLAAPAALLPGEPLLLLASLITLAPEQAAPGANARVTAQIELPDRTTDTLTLYDDGHHGDGVAGDGVYGARYTRTLEAGRYRITLAAQETGAGSAPEVKRDVHVRGRPADGDGDGLPDHWEAAVGLNTGINDTLQDPDADGLLNVDEYRQGADPYAWDSDGDGLRDGDEVLGGYYVTSPRNADTDLGGANDALELARGTHPLDPSDDAEAAHPVLLPTVWRPYASRPRPARHLITGEDVWLATASGLVHWSGVDHSYVKYTTVDGLAHNVVNVVIRDPGGALWIGAEGGVSRLQDGVWTTFTSAQGLAHDRVRDILVAGDGALWFASAGGLSRLAGDVWTTFTPETSGLPHHDVYALASDAMNHLWVGTRRGLAAFDGYTWRTYPIETATPGWITAIAVDRLGYKWVGTWGAGIYRLDTRDPEAPIWTRYRLLDDPDARAIGLSGDFITGITRDTITRDSVTRDSVARDALWFHSLEATGRIAGNRAETYIADALLEAARAFEDIAIEEAVHAWVGTRPLTQLPPHLRVIAEAQTTPWFGRYAQVGTRRIDYAAGHRPERISVLALYQDAAGRIWFGAERGAGVLEDGRWHTYALNGYAIPTLAGDAAGRIWLGTDGDGAWRFDPQAEEETAWLHITPGQGQVAGYARAIAATPEGQVWFGAGGGLGGLSRYDIAGDVWTQYWPGLLLKDRTLYDMVVDRAGRPWLAFSNGIFALDIAAPQESQWTPYLEGLRVSALASAPDGALWAGAGKELYRYTGETWQPVPGAPASAINALAFDAQGRLWIGAAEGVTGLAADGEANLKPFDTLAVGPARDLMIDDQGRLWIAAAEGVTVYRP